MRRGKGVFPLSKCQWFCEEDKAAETGEVQQREGSKKQKGKKKSMPQKEPKTWHELLEP